MRLGENFTIGYSLIESVLQAFRIRIIEFVDSDVLAGLNIGPTSYFRQRPSISLAQQYERPPCTTLREERGNVIETTATPGEYRVMEHRVSA